jgi:hypothetical protein
MNGDLSDSSTFLADGLRGCDLPAGVGVGEGFACAAGETVKHASATAAEQIIFVIVFMFLLSRGVNCLAFRDFSSLRTQFPGGCLFDAHVRAYSHLSFAFAACFVCHCMFEGESPPPRFNGFT